MNRSLLVQQLDALLTDEHNFIANLANASALLYNEIHDINWGGFYLYDESTDSLELGPFQGKVACMHIKPGSGVCGTAFETQTIQRIANVHKFPGHIACDSASNSEIVLPLTKGAKKIGVLDIDSPSPERFSESDQKELTDFVNVLLEHL
ncbi:GAF domain-containing protein [Ligilactobacillus pobuzihii]|uniref:GAF domain protein n=1 Tax=Ligilactobacillus pobuzihii TaxID=449659 RepID=A0A0R2LNI9_9LACO|nr:GAF domain-containing protein [Ligilactobacillus pobuzihii]KRK10824.1 GAF domain protein [Ligilactobacillus pobuzihii E100301 = KCTC 13174]KRO01040.1 GAF domain protein [Ligilactobacillus pobuzihii]GEN47884.1 hypothetical protein LPO01_06760 [Ligilactobacillus pobuzihii]